MKLSPARVIPSSDIRSKELFAKPIIGQILTSCSCKATTSKYETVLGLTVKLEAPVGLIRVHVKSFQRTLTVMTSSIELSSSGSGRSRRS